MDLFASNFSFLVSSCEISLIFTRRYYLLYFIVKKLSSVNPAQRITQFTLLNTKSIHTPPVVFSERTKMPILSILIPGHKSFSFSAECGNNMFPNRV